MRQRVETALREAREALSKRDVLLASQKADALKVVLQEAGQTRPRSISGTCSAVTRAVIRNNCSTQHHQRRFDFERF